MGVPTFFESVKPQKYDPTPTSGSWAVTVPPPNILEAASAITTESMRSSDSEEVENQNNDEDEYQNFVHYYQGCLDAEEDDENENSDERDNKELEEAKKNSVISDLAKIEGEEKEDIRPLVNTSKRTIFKSLRQLWHSSSSGPSFASLSTFGGRRRSNSNYGHRLVCGSSSSGGGHRHHSKSNKLLVSPTSMLCHGNHRYFHQHEDNGLLNGNIVTKSSSGGNTNKWLALNDEIADGPGSGSGGCQSHDCAHDDAIASHDCTSNLNDENNDPPMLYHEVTNFEYINHDLMHDLGDVMMHDCDDDEFTINDGCDFGFQPEEVTTEKVCQWDPKQGIAYTYSI